MRIYQKNKKIAVSSKEKVITTLDSNGDGNIDINDIIILSLKTPGIKINREKFLRKELSKNYSQDVINKAVKDSPAKANIDVKEIDIITDNVIKYERNCVSGISAVLGTPGGVGMIATMPSILWLYVKNSTKAYVFVWIS